MPTEDTSMCARSRQNRRSQLTVFVSSTMEELYFVRDTLEETLRSKGVEPWLFENDAMASPWSWEEQVRPRVEECLVYMAILCRRLGPGTRKEFNWATKKQKPRFVYLLKSPTGGPEAALRTFIKDDLRGLVRGEKVSAQDVADAAAHDIWGWLVGEYQRVAGELARVGGKRDGSALRRLGELARCSSKPLGGDGDYLLSQVVPLLEGGFWPSS